MSFPGEFVLGIRSVSIKYSFLMHNQGRKLYAVSTTGHILYDILISPNGLNPSEASPRRTLRGSAAKSGYLSSRFFHVEPSAGCRKTPYSLTRSRSCHCISSDVCREAYNRFNRSFKGKYRNIFCDTFFPFGFHLLSLQIGHTSAFSRSFRNNTQLLMHALIISYPMPKRFSFAFAS